MISEKQLKWKNSQNKYHIFFSLTYIKNTQKDLIESSAACCLGCMKIL